MTLFMKLAPHYSLDRTSDGLHLGRGSYSPALRRTFGKGWRHCVKGTEKPAFGKGTQLIVSLGEYLLSRRDVSRTPSLSDTEQSDC